MKYRYDISIRPVKAELAITSTEEDPLPAEEWRKLIGKTIWRSTITRVGVDTAGENHIKSLESGLTDGDACPANLLEATFRVISESEKRATVSAT